MAGPKTPANEDEIQTQGRKDNAAQPLNAAEDNAGAERYPSVSKDDSIRPSGRTRPRVGGERRSFDGNVEGAPAPRKPDASVNQGRLGSGSDPVEGKR